MKFVNLLFHHETRSPLLAMLFASFIGVGLVIARIVLTRDVHNAYLIWNLFLAWLPLIFALLACEKVRTGQGRGWRFGALGGAWLLFFPNAPYIFTDVIHVVYRSHRNFWVDLLLILICAMTGLVLGFVSLYLMQSLVRRRFGQIVSWLFVAAVTGLSGFGIYLGRILRFNSWDVIAQPVKLFNGISTWAANPLASSQTFTFPVLFAIFLLLAYVMLYTLTHLPKPEMFRATNGKDSDVPQAA